MTSVTGEHGPQGALGRGDEQSRQVVIGRPAFGAAIGGEASLTLAPAQAGGCRSASAWSARPSKASISSRV